MTDHPQPETTPIPMSAEAGKHMLTQLTTDLNDLLRKYELAPCIASVLLTAGTKAIMLQGSPQPTPDGYAAMSWEFRTAPLSDVIEEGRNQ